MRRRRLWAALVLAGVLVLGTVIGAATATMVITRRLRRLVAAPKQTMARIYGWELGRRLHLSAAQRAEVERSAPAAGYPALSNANRRLIFEFACGNLPSP